MSVKTCTILRLTLTYMIICVDIDVGVSQQELYDFIVCKLGCVIERCPPPLDNMTI